MNPKKTLAIILLFAVVLGAYLWDTERVEKKAAVEKEESRLVVPEKASLSEITLAGKQGTTALVKQGEEWKLTAPHALMTDKSAVDQLLTQLDTTNKQEPFDADAAKLADFGLDQPEIKATIKSAEKNYTEDIHVGGQTSDGSAYYAQLASSPRIFTVSPALRDALAKGVNDLRDKRTLPFDIAKATTVTLTYGGQTFHAEKHGEQWQLTQPIVAEADNAKIEEMLKSWNGAKAADFVDTDTQNVAALVPYGLDSPAWSGTVYAPQEDGPASGTLFIAHSALASDEETESGEPDSSARTYALAQGGSYLFSVEDSVVKKLQPTLTDLRNKKLFKLKTSDVAKFTIQVRENTIPLVRKDGGSWQFADDPAAQVDQGQVNAKLAELIALQATRFVDGPTTPGQTALETPFAQLTIATADGATTEGLITGAKDKIDGVDFVYARTLASDQVYGVDWTKPGSFMLTRDDLIDKSLLDFDVEAVQKLKISDGPHVVTYTRTAAGAWEGETSGTQLTATPSQVNALLYSLDSLKWKERVDPTQETGQTLIKTQNLEAPARRIDLMTEHDEVLASFGQGGETERLVYVKRAEGEYFAVDKAAIGTTSRALNDLLSGAAPPALGN